MHGQQPLLPVYGVELADWLSGDVFVPRDSTKTHYLRFPRGEKGDFEWVEHVYNENVAFAMFTKYV